MKLFQIEEPEGPPLDASGPGAAIGIALGAAGAAVACSVGGNAEILPDADGEDLLQEPDLAALLLALRSRAEKQLARPVTHAVVAATPRDDAALARAADAAGLGAPQRLRRRGRDGRRRAGGGGARRDAGAARGVSDVTTKMTFIERDGTRREVEAPIGLSVLEIAHRNDIDIEGACEGSLACSTCHVIIEPDWYELLKDASEDEEDMLDLAFGLTQTSRLGCQIIMTEELDGLIVRLPQATRNMMNL